MDFVKTDQFQRIQGAKLQIGCKTYPVFKGANTIGRNKGAVVNLKNLNVSQNQAIIVIVDQTLQFISDLNSSNGTFLHETKLTPFRLYELTNNAKLKFGNVLATYSKINLGANVGINLETEVLEMTQNMTQTFYGANTQLIDNTFAEPTNEHGYVNPHHNESQLRENVVEIEMEDIHDMATQKIEYPPQISTNTNLQTDIKAIFKIPDIQKVADNCVIVEKVDLIHDAPTQLIVRPTSPDHLGNTQPTEVIHEGTVEVDVMEETIDTGIHDAQTQMILLNEENDRFMGTNNQSSFKTDSQATEINTPNVDDQLITEENTVEKQQTPVKEVSPGPDNENSREKNNDQAEDQNASQETIVSQFEIHPSQRVGKKNVIHSSQIPSTSGVNNTFDDSFINLENLRSSDNGVREEMIINESTNSNDSMDFLTMRFSEGHVDMPIENQEQQCSGTTKSSDILPNPVERLTGKNHFAESDSDTDIDEPAPKSSDKVKESLDYENLSNSSKESGIIRKKKRPVLKLPSLESSQEYFRENLSGSDTEIESTQEIGVRKRKPPRKLPFSQSDTEVDDVKHIGDQKTSKKLDSDENQNEKKDTSDSETDCEDNLAGSKVRNVEASKKNAQIGRNKTNEVDPVFSPGNKFDDSDFIPSTQDVCEDAFDQPLSMSKENANHSSEESFKLGITELMDDVDNVLNEPNKLGKNNNFKKPEESCLSGPKDEQKVDVEVEDIDDVYMVQTQKITQNENNIASTSSNIEDNNEDIYVMATQSLKPDESESQFKTPKKFNFRKKVPTLDESITTILGPKTNNEVYPSATQVMGADENDIYLAATQKISEPATIGHDVEEQKDVEDIYIQPTQRLNVETGISSPIDLDDNEDIFMASTQKINVDIVNPSGKDRADDLDIYDKPTQCLDSDNNTQLEVQFSNNDEANLQVRPDNPLPRILSIKLKGINTDQISQTEPVIKHSKVSISNTSSTVEISKQIDRPETLSQIESFIKEPVNIVVPRNKKGRNLDATKVKEERPETLSQIEAFIKEPLAVTVSKNLKTSPQHVLKVSEFNNDKCDVETLSQIQAFIDKPFQNERSARVLAQTSVKEIVGISDNALIQESPNKSVERLRSLKRKGTNRNEAQAGTSNNILNTVTEDDDNLETSPKKPTLRISEVKQEETNKVISDTEKSFIALLESKTSKVRKTNKKSVLTEIKVKATKNRRSMGTADSSTIDLSEVGIRKSKRNIVNNNVLGITDGRNTYSADEHLNSDSEVPTKILKMSSQNKKNQRHTEGILPCARRTARKHSSSSEPDVKMNSKNRHGDRGKSIETSAFNDSSDNTSSSRSTIQTMSSISEIGEIVNKNNTEEIVQPVRRTTRKNSSSSNSDMSGRNCKNNRMTVERDISAGPTISKSFSTSELDCSVSSSSNMKHTLLNIHEESEENTKTTMRTSKKPLKNQLSADSKNIGHKNSVVSNQSVELSTPTSKRVMLKGKQTRSNEHISYEFGTPKREQGSIKNEVLNSAQVNKNSVVSNQSAEPSTPTRKRVMSRGKQTGSNEHISDEFSTPKRDQRSVKSEIPNSAERGKRKQKPKVVFTMLESPQLESLIKHMGGSVVDSVDACTVLLTEHVKRSQKLLSAVGQGKPICSPQWLHGSKKNNEFLDPWDYILVDEEAERKWNFSLKESLSRAFNRKLLENYKFQIMASNAADVLKGAIESCGGKCVARYPGKNSEGTFMIVASPDQKSKFSKIVKQNPDIKVVEPEAIFDGVLRQEIRFSRHMLS